MESKSELIASFSTQFAATKEEIRKKIDELPISTGDLDVVGELNSISEEIHALSKTLQDSTLFLPSYSVKVRQNEIRALESELKEKEELLIPKKKFGFKSKMVKPDQPAVTENSETPEEKQEKMQENDDSNFLTIENLDGETVTFGEQQLGKADVLVRNLNDTVLHLNGSPSTLRLANLRNCKLICGPVYTSIFVDDCKDCLLFLCCQQLRAHTSEALDIYLRVRSRAIIEDCTRVRFGPYSWNHERAEELHRLTGIDEKMERFDCVDDFNWLAFTTPSPNWTIIPEGERIQFPI